MGSHSTVSPGQTRNRLLRLAGIAALAAVPTAIGAALLATFGTEPTTVGGVLGAAAIATPWPILTSIPTQSANEVLGTPPGTADQWFTNAAVRLSITGLPLAAGLAIGGFWATVGGYASVGCAVMALSDLVNGIETGIIAPLLDEFTGGPTEFTYTTMQAEDEP